MWPCISAQCHRVQIIQSGIEATVKNLNSAETQASQDFAAGRLTTARVATRHQVHRNLTQYVSQLATQHAHLSHSFESHQLVFDNISIAEDPTCSRAIFRCIKVILHAGITNRDLVLPDCSYSLVHNLIFEWFSPAFNCSYSEFHRQVWLRFPPTPPTPPPATPASHASLPNAIDADDDDAIFYDIETGDGDGDDDDGDDDNETYITASRYTFAR